MRLLPAVAALFAATATATAVYDPKACNQSPSLCTKPYSSLLHLGAHDSAFVRGSTLASAANQYFNATIQLSAGIRLLQSQLHLDDRAIKLCHTSCSLFDAGPLEKWLQEIHAWLLANPSDVVTLLLVNDDLIPATDLAAVFKRAGLDKLAYVPETAAAAATVITEWPTLGEMIEAGKRLVAFISTSADTSAVPYLLPEFDHVFETAFETTEPEDFSCAATRPEAAAGGRELEALATRMPLMNRFLYNEVSGTLQIYMSNDTYANVLNGAKGVGNLKDGVEECMAKTWGRRGGFVLLDFVDEGEPMKVVDAYNNVTAAVNRVAFPPNEKEVEDKAKLDVGGWDKVQRLAKEARKGGEVKTGEWVSSAGKWMAVHKW